LQNGNTAVQFPLAFTGNFFAELKTPTKVKLTNPFAALKRGEDRSPAQQEKLKGMQI